jgi:EXS family
VLASVGSFVVSERVLKPKASVLVILGCVLAYDLTTKTHDSVSLRVYRGTIFRSMECLVNAADCLSHEGLILHGLIPLGPGLLAFCLMMAAYSLRTWRRNGVACDELLFLPGSSHGESTDSITPPAGGGGGSGSISNSAGVSAGSPSRPPVRSEGDVAAGGWVASQRQPQQQVVVEMISTGPSEHLNVGESMNRSRTVSKDSSISSINEFANLWEDDLRRDDEDPFLTNSSDEENLLSTHRRSAPTDATHRNAGPNGERSPNTTGESEALREDHTNVRRLGYFFFFRSSTTSTHNAAYAPSGPSVVGAAIDLSMPVLFNFHLFIEAWNHMKDSNGSEASAKILPLIFLTVLIVRTVFPPRRRGRFWSTMKYTATAPFFPSSFRDGYIGDVLTSLVRPLQDVMFALAYYVTVIWGSATSKYGLAHSGDMLQKSWILHNVVLPSCALLPLWWKFLQTLRESYDTGRRWPSLGNAFKYLSASVVILYGMTNPENRRSLWWIIAFSLTTAYQIFWDTVMDWDLFVIAPRENEGLDISESSSWFTTPISSVRPDSYWILAIQRNLVPVRKFIRSLLSRIPSYKQIQLRPRRLYKSEAFYWRIFIYNSIFRFCWMLSFIPAYHFSNGDVVTTFSSDTNSYVGVLLPIAEILRRTFWGFLYLEMQTIRMSDGDGTCEYSQVSTDNADGTEHSLVSVDSNSKQCPRHFLPPWLGMQQQIQHEVTMTSSSWKLSNCFQFSEDTREKLFIAELAVWGVAFVGCGIWATS